MADVLPNYGWSREAARYRDLSTGRFVARATVTELLEAQVNSAERRLGNLVTAAHEGRVSPAWFAETMRTELRRAHLQNRALGVGGMDRLTQSDYGSVGRKLRDDYARVARLAQELRDGTVTLPQALNRVQGYMGTARLEFFEAERRALQRSERQWEERRVLGAAEHCPGCLELAARSWQPAGLLPLPADGSTECGQHCRCTMERREVRTEAVRA